VNDITGAYLLTYVYSLRSVSVKVSVSHTGQRRCLKLLRFSSVLWNTFRSDALEN